MNLVNYIKAWLTGRSARSNLFKKNVLFIYLFQGIDLLLGFISMPLTLKYLTPMTLGIYLTANSIVEWFSYSDIGIGEGVRNKLAESFSKNDNEKAKYYLSSAYFILGVIFLSVLLLFFIVNPFLNWTKILNTDSSLSYEVTVLSYIIFTSFCLKSILNLINKVFFALQIPAITHFITIITRILYIISILLLIKFTTSSLIYYGMVQNIILISIPIVLSIYFYRTRFKKFAPSFKFIKLRYAKNVANLGFRFFILNVSLLVTMLSNNFLISHYVGNTEVTFYNIANKYYSIAYTLFIVIITPLWSAFTDSYYKGEIKWIVNMQKKLRKIWLLMALLMAVMILFSSIFFRLWLGSEIIISYRLSISVVILLLTYSWLTIFTSFLNSVSKVKIQIILIVFGAIINIPVSILFVKVFNLGSAGIILGSVVSLLPGTLVFPIQSYKILRKRAYGIWGK